MISLLKRIWRKYFLDVYLNIKYRHILKNNKDIDTVFSKIFAKNYRGSKESKSGEGSTKENTRYILASIKKLISDYKIHTFLDVPCGDCNWIDPENIGCEYIGGDIVDELIKENKKNIPNINFKKIDITSDRIDKVDIIFCREYLQHLSYDNIFKALNNFKKSGSKYLLTSTYINGMNKNINNGMYFEINLDLPPFNLPKPILKIEEKDNNIFYKKEHPEYLYLYELDKIIMKSIK